MELELVEAPVCKCDISEVYLTLLHDNIGKIQFFEAVDSDTFIVMSDGVRKIIKVPLHEIEVFLPSDSFFRCGWSHLVNVNRIDQCYLLNEATIVMDCGEEIPVPRFQRQMVANVMERLYSSQNRKIG